MGCKVICCPVLFCLVVNRLDRASVSVCACMQMMTLDRVAAEELGHIQTIDDNAARYHVTSYLDPSQQLDSVPSPKLP